MGSVRVLGAVVAALTIAGCGTAARRVVRDAPVTGRQISCSFAVDYKSLAQLRRDSTSVAVVSPTGVVRTRVVSGLAMKDATVRVVELVAVRRLPSSFKLFDVADSHVQGSENCSPAISKGNAYLVYLTPFRLHRKGPPGRALLGRRRASGQLHPHRHAAAERSERAVVRPSDERCGDVAAAANLGHRRPR